MSNPKSYRVPRAFVTRRLHSITGLFLVLFLIEHLLTNSQSALFVSQDGSGFVKMVNHIHDLPFLPFLEIFLIAVPILIHLYWGILYLRQSEPNSGSSDGSRPSLSYGKNKAFTWQRITAWILVFAIVGHVIQMRFINYPASAVSGPGEHSYMVKISMDDGLYTVAERLGVILYSQDMVAEGERVLGEIQKVSEELPPISRASLDEVVAFNPEKGALLDQRQKLEQQGAWLEALTSKSLRPGEVIAVADTAGTAMLLTVRDTFKDPLMILLYSLFVVSACFHAFNGLWTFMISWGFTATPKSQRLFSYVCTSLMVLVAFLGLASIWGTYLVTLNH